jgi:hypothetical protein
MRKYISEEWDQKSSDTLSNSRRVCGTYMQRKSSFGRWKTYVYISSQSNFIRYEGLDCKFWSTVVCMDFVQNAPTHNTACCKILFLWLTVLFSVEMSESEADDGYLLFFIPSLWALLDQRNASQQNSFQNEMLVHMVASVDIFLTTSLIFSVKKILLSKIKILQLKLFELYPIRISSEWDR